MGSVHLLLGRLLLGDILLGLLHRECIPVAMQHLHQRLACRRFTLSRLAQAEVPPVNVNLQLQEVSARRPLQVRCDIRFLLPSSAFVNMRWLFFLAFFCLWRFCRIFYVACTK